MEWQFNYGISLAERMTMEWEWMFYIWPANDGIGIGGCFCFFVKSKPIGPQLIVDQWMEWRLLWWAKLNSIPEPEPKPKPKPKPNPGSWPRPWMSSFLLALGIIIVFSVVIVIQLSSSNNDNNCSATQKSNRSRLRRLFGVQHSSPSLHIRRSSLRPPTLFGLLLEDP